MMKSSTAAAAAKSSPRRVLANIEKIRLFNKKDYNVAQNTETETKKNLFAEEIVTNSNEQAEQEQQQRSYYEQSSNTVRQQNADTETKMEKYLRKEKELMSNNMPLFDDFWEFRRMAYDCEENMPCGDKQREEAVKNFFLNGMREEAVESFFLNGMREEAVESFFLNGLREDKEQRNNDQQDEAPTNEDDHPTMAEEMDNKSTFSQIFEKAWMCSFAADAQKALEHYQQQQQQQEQQKRFEEEEVWLPQTRNYNKKPVLWSPTQSDIEQDAHTRTDIENQVPTSYWQRRTKELHALEENDHQVEEQQDANKQDSKRKSTDEMISLEDVDAGNYNGQRQVEFKNPSDAAKIKRINDWGVSNKKSTTEKFFVNEDNHNHVEKEEDDPDDEQPPQQHEIYIPPALPQDMETIFSGGIASGEHFDKLQQVPFKVTGWNAPAAISAFEDAKLCELLLQNIKKSKYSVPTPVQKAAIPAIAKGRDVMACAQTGSGKTAAYLLPIINALLMKDQPYEAGRPQALIIAPTRELAVQIYHAAHKFAYGSTLKVGILYGGTSTRHQGREIKRNGQLLICTSGRLIDFLERGIISFHDISHLVLDEADYMLGSDSTEQLDFILKHSTMPKKKQFVMFSATFPEEIQDMATNFLNSYIFVAVGTIGSASADVEQTILSVKSTQKNEQLMRLLSEDKEQEGKIVFVGSIQRAEYLESYLNGMDVPTVSIHSLELQSQRELALAHFKAGKIKILLATSIAGRGLDIKAAQHIINFDMPNTIDEYVQRIGRTGRIGNVGRATSFYEPVHNKRIAPDLVRILEEAKQTVPKFLKKNIGIVGIDERNPFEANSIRGDKFNEADLTMGLGDYAKSAPIEHEAEMHWSMH